MTNSHTPRPDTTPQADRDWFGGRRWTGIAAVGFIIVVAAAVVIIVVSRHGGDKLAGPVFPHFGASSPSSPLTSVAVLPATPPTSAPAGTTWTIYETVALPSLAGSGPAHMTGAVATGYAHTPVGALIATVNEGLRYQLAPDASWRQAAESMLARGTGYEAWLKVRAANPYGPGGAAAGADLGQIAGFQFVSYTPTDAVIQIVTRQSDGSLTVATEHVTWIGGDWKFVPGQDGGAAANVQQVDSLDGFIPWKGV